MAYSWKVALRPCFCKVSVRRRSVVKLFVLWTEIKLHLNLVRLFNGITFVTILSTFQVYVAIDWPWLNNVFILIGISLFTYILAVQLPLLKEQHGRTERNTLQPWVNNSLNLNLFVCRKRQLNQRRISLLKRKAQHRRKQIQRKKRGKIKTQRARLKALGFFLSIVLFYSRLAVCFKCTSLRNPAPFNNELSPSNPVRHENKITQRKQIHCCNSRQVLLGANVLSACEGV